MRKGFTLIELSIVLVIIGLLVGGILAAQSMIDTTRINSQVRQFQQLDTITQNFITKYNQLPGDCSFCNHDDWPGICSYPNCQGNNDGAIGQGAPNCNVSPNRMECAYYFSDLVEMSNMPGTYGRPNTELFAGTTFGEGEIAPLAAIGKGGVVVNQNTENDLFWVLTGDLTYGYLSQAVVTITPVQALALDSKLDDGLPTAGDVTIANPTGVNTRPEIYPHGTGYVIAEANPVITAYNFSSPSTPRYQMQIKSGVKK